MRPLARDRLADVREDLDLRAFAPLADCDEETLSELRRKIVARRFDPGQLLFSQGEAAPGLLFVGKGQVRIFKLSRDGREQHLCLAPANACVGCPLLVQGCSPASADALDTGTMFFLPVEAMERAISTAPAMRLALLHYQADRQRGLLQVASILGLPTASARLAAALIFESGGQDGWQSKLSHAELGHRAGLSREEVSRILAVWQRRGFVDVGRRSLVLRDAASLAAVISGGTSNVTSVTDWPQEPEDSAVGSNGALGTTLEPKAWFQRAGGRGIGPAMFDLPIQRPIFGKLAGFSGDITCQPFDKGTMLTLGGEVWKGLDVLAGGSAIVSHVYHGHEQIIGLVHTGEATDIVPLFLKDEPNWFSVRAVEPGALLHIAGDAARRLVAESQEFQSIAGQLMACQLERLVHRVHDLAFKDVVSRLATFIVEETVANGSQATGTPMVARHLNLRELASLLGTGREVVSRSLSRLAQGGSIRLDRGVIRVLDLSALEARADRS